MNDPSQTIPIDVYSGFNWLGRKVLSTWESKTVFIKVNTNFHAVIEDINARLLDENIILFFDHHYAFDALPLGLGLGSYIKNFDRVLIPYAVHLDLGVGRKGEPSFHYWVRTQIFHWFVKRISKGNPGIQFSPVARAFEMDNPRMRNIVEERFEGINQKYIRAFHRNFSKSPTGQVCFLTPFSGIGFPDKPVLHPQLYRSIDLVQSKIKREVPCYLTGAYPNWSAYRNYLAPLLAEHYIVIRGPFKITLGDYELAKEEVEANIAELRKTAEFTPPDYQRILNK